MGLPASSLADGVLTSGFWPADGGDDDGPEPDAGGAGVAGLGLLRLSLEDPLPDDDDALGFILMWLLIALPVGDSDSETHKQKTHSTKKSLKSLLIAD